MKIHWNLRCVLNRQYRLGICLYLKNLIVREICNVGQVIHIAYKEQAQDNKRRLRRLEHPISLGNTMAAIKSCTDTNAYIKDPKKWACSKQIQYEC